MAELHQSKKNLIMYILTLFVVTLFALWLRRLDIESSWQLAGMINFSLGFVMLAAYMSAQILKIARLPLISGYIIVGIIAGPYVSGFLTDDMIDRFGFINDIALSFIALTAGGALHLQMLRKRRKIIVLNIVLLTVVVFGFVFTFFAFMGSHFNFTGNLASPQIIAFAVLIGVVAVARSPSSAIAIISESRASGPFTETVLGVTIAMDVLIIILFTIAVTAARIFVGGSEMPDTHVFVAVSTELVISFFLGALLGKGIALYIDRIRHNLPLFLLFLAFGVSKLSLWLNNGIEIHFDVYLHLKPLLICMGAGFTVQNFSKTGAYFMDNLDRVSLPVYVLFFSLAGASLNFEALKVCWMLALCLAIVRVAGIFCATWLAGTIAGDPPLHNRTAWMAYLTQAGVAIGLAQIAESEFPGIGVYLTTVILALIFVNQLVGPVTFKTVLNLVGESKVR
ncbi:MAG: cation:proton antiporter [Deltaproteobacteria bacterium]|nr:cation:proton antiporter [Deltaproteobacteria bacterium]MBN2688970.1 cation:proton antiporter [Deltaproteobacteria bacterium]